MRLLECLLHKGLDLGNLRIRYVALISDILIYQILNKLIANDYNYGKITFALKLCFSQNITMAKLLDQLVLYKEKLLYILV